MVEEQSNRASFSESLLVSDLALLMYLGLFKFTLHIATAGSYGYITDELYFIACSDHLDWAYVDQPPLSILMLKIARWILGDSLYAIRLLSAAAGVLYRIEFHQSLTII
jgi:4-amino-4-deoxy-L-arabinose transferase-like glycosyltransferase